MTSFSKALFNRNPRAAMELRKHQLATYRSGEPRRLPDWQNLQAQAAQNFFGTRVPAGQSFGKRVPTGLSACAANCGHVACKSGCTLIGQQG